MDYFALIGDLEKSRELTNRASVQRNLQAVIARTNKQLKRQTVSPLKLTAGDEIQGISRDPCYALEVILALSDAIAPEQFSWGLGLGGVSTDLSDDVALIDGPCFHRARRALESARKNKVWFEAEGLDAVSAPVLTAIMNLMGAIREDWTERQTVYVRQARDLPQIEVARVTGKAPSTVSRALRATKFDRIVQAEQAARIVLQNLTLA